MTEKRFVLGYNKIKDKEDDIVYGLTSIDNQDFGLYKFIEKANALHEENKLHKERISLLSSLLDLADAIIDTIDNEKAKKVWENKNEQTEKEWEEILND